MTFYASADAYTAYGNNLEAGLDGDLDAQDDAAATFNDHYYSAKAEMYQEAYDPLQDSDEERGAEAPLSRRHWHETPSSTIYIRVRPARPQHLPVHRENCMQSGCFLRPAISWSS